ncbi:hypothetical protein [Bifidobacterium castoris]|nr:hypothetical protein [Bifidobacterium castoris]
MRSDDPSVRAHSPRALHDLGHVPPFDSKPQWNRSQLLQHGWKETGERPWGFEDGSRLFWYRHGDVLLVMDDTSLLAVIIPVHARRRDMKTIPPTIASLTDWGKGAGTKRITELQAASCRTATACDAAHLPRIIADMAMGLLAEQCELLGAAIYQQHLQYRGWRDLPLQHARIARCRTSRLVDRHDPRWENLDRQLDAYAAYMDACYLNSDRSSRTAGLILSAVFSSTGIISLSLSNHWQPWSTAFALIACVFLFLFALPRK